MYDRKKVLGLIPARGGSKGVPKKNVRSLAGKPLIAYTIECAKETNIFDYLMVNTDSEEIAETAEKYGAKVPFIRPPELATDTACGMDVIIYTINWFEDKDSKFDILVYLQPTSPLRLPEDIINALNIMKDNKANAVISVTEAEYPPLWTNILPHDLKMDNFIRKDIESKNRQELPTYYRLNGAIYIARWDYLKKYADWYHERVYAYIMPQERSIDIDSEFDFLLAEFIMQKKTDVNRKRLR